MTRPTLIPVAVVVFALVLAACEATPPPSPGPTGEATATPAVTAAPPPPGGRLADVLSRGELICGINGGLPGFSVLDDATGEYTGFDADYCRALAVAVLGDANAVEFRETTTDARGPALQTGEIDVLIRNTTWTVSRDTSWGLFAPTTFYDGQGIMATTEIGAETLEDLDGATICAQSGTTTELNLTDQMRAAGAEFEPLIFPEIDPTYAAYEEGRCDAVTSDRSQLVSRRTTFANPDDHVILDVVMSKEPLGPVAPLGDDSWFNVVKWVVFATIEAEELGITSDNVQERFNELSADPDANPVAARLLGADGDLGSTALRLENDWVVDVILAVGNYGEIYDRNLGPGTPFDLDRGPNQLWTEGGLLYSPPYR